MASHHQPQRHCPTTLSQMSSQDKCPVDHKLREVWQRKAKESQTSSNIPTTTPQSEPQVCPVDHNARAKWLGDISVTTQTKVEAIEERVGSKEEDKGCDSAKMNNDPKYSSDVNLPIEREISSIPRTNSDGNWIYPSHKQFYEAMKRKNWSPEASDMKTVIPIHNEVNEIAWRRILEWERSLHGEGSKCGGISLTSFKGDLKKLTPRAWFRLNILGQDKPFDRHDWLVDRCGVDVPYVIDFYDGGKDGGVFLDVRPNLKSWEGFKLRVYRSFGWA